MNNSIWLTADTVYVNTAKSFTRTSPTFYVCQSFIKGSLCLHAL